jgi:DNA repair protein SbcD/Mre11
VRIIHTSDWHIGRRFERESLEADQRAFLSWLADQVAAHAVDLVIVAGDVYDRALPAEDAVAVLDDGLDALRNAGASVAMISGNHDSARRLGFGARRQAHGGVHVFADVLRPPAPWVFEAGGEEVAIVAVPFLDPLTTAAPRSAPDGSPRARTHEHVLVDALASGRAALERLPNVPSLAVAHATVAGSVRSDSEKVLAIGGADAVGAACFDGFDAVLLGHLHRPQPVGRDGRIAYSGSPLPYSFSETHPKAVRMLEITGGAVASVREITIPIGRPVATLEGPLEALLTEPSFDGYVEHWVAARLTDSTTQVQPMERLRRRFPHAVSVGYAAPAWVGRPGGAGVGGLFGTGQDVNGTGRGTRSVEDVVLAFLAELSGREPEGWERELALEAVAAAQRGEAQ